MFNLLSITLPHSGGRSNLRRNDYLVTKSQIVYTTDILAGENL